MGCGCSNGTATIQYTSSGQVIDRSNPCEVVTEDMLGVYLYMVQCVKNKGAYQQTNTTEAEIDNAINILTLWIADKQQDYKSCTYQDYLPLMQDIVKRIIISEVCK